MPQNAKMPHCPIHHDVSLVCPACLGARTAGITSKAKARASKRNGRLGGRPKLPEHVRGCLVDPKTSSLIDRAKYRFTLGCPRCDYDREHKRKTG
jgi:hypothetical protein